MVEWGNFRVLLPLGVGFDELEALRYGKEISPVSALLLANNYYEVATSVM